MRYTALVFVGLLVAACGETTVEAPVAEPRAHADVAGVWSEASTGCANCWPIAFELHQADSTLSGCGVGDVNYEVPVMIRGEVAGDSVRFTASGEDDATGEAVVREWAFDGVADGNLISGTSTARVILSAGDTATIWTDQPVSYSQVGTLPGPHCG